MSSDFDLKDRTFNKILDTFFLNIDIEHCLRSGSVLPQLDTVQYRQLTESCGSVEIDTFLLVCSLVSQLSLLKRFPRDKLGLA